MSQLSWVQDAITTMEDCLWPAFVARMGIAMTSCYGNTVIQWNQVSWDGQVPFTWERGCPLLRGDKLNVNGKIKVKSTTCP